MIMKTLTFGAGGGGEVVEAIPSQECILGARQKKQVVRSCIQVPYNPV